MKTLKILIATIFLFYGSLVPAYAVTFTVTDNILNSQSFSSGTTVKSLFYIANLFPEEPFVINSAYFSFQMSSGSPRTLVGSQVITTVTNRTSDFFGNKTIESTITTENYYTSGQNVQVQLSMGSLSQSLDSVSTSSYSDTRRIRVEEICSVTEVNGFCFGDLNINTYTERNFGGLYSIGDFSGYLSDSDVSNIFNTGLITWSLGVAGGSLSLYDATLTIDYDLISSNQPSISVPEASSIYLFAFGLLGLLGAARRNALKRGLPLCPYCKRSIYRVSII